MLRFGEITKVISNSSATTLTTAMLTPFKCSVRINKITIYDKELTHSMRAYFKTKEDNGKRERERECESEERKKKI